MLPLISQLSTAAKTAPILPKIPPPQQPHPFLLPRSLIRSFLHAPGRARTRESARTLNRRRRNLEDDNR